MKAEHRKALFAVVGGLMLAMAVIYGFVGLTRLGESMHTPVHAIKR